MTGQIVYRPLRWGGFLFKATLRDKSEPEEVANEDAAMIVTQPANAMGDPQVNANGSGSALPSSS